jgi:hypothetical protein
MRHNSVRYPPRRDTISHDTPPRSHLASPKGVCHKFALSLSCANTAPHFCHVEAGRHSRPAVPPPSRRPRVLASQSSLLLTTNTPHPAQTPTTRPAGPREREPSGRPTQQPLGLARPAPGPRRGPLVGYSAGALRRHAGRRLSSPLPPPSSFSPRPTRHPRDSDRSKGITTLLRLHLEGGCGADSGRVGGPVRGPAGRGGGGEGATADGPSAERG